MFVMSKEPSLNSTSRGGFYVTGKGKPEGVCQRVWILVVSLYIFMFESQHVHF